MCVCGGGGETWQHVWESCRKWKEWEEGWSERVGWALGEEGEGEWWREVEEKRARVNEDGGWNGRKGEGEDEVRE